MSSPQASLLPAASCLLQVSHLQAQPPLQGLGFGAAASARLRPIPSSGCTEQPPFGPLGLLPRSQMSERGPFSRAQEFYLASSGSCCGELFHKYLPKEPVTGIRAWFSRGLGAWIPRPFAAPLLLRAYGVPLFPFSHSFHSSPSPTSSNIFHGLYATYGIPGTYLMSPSTYFPFMSMITFHCHSNRVRRWW